MSTEKFSKEQELARELSKRGMSRRQMLKVGALLGLGSASMAALAACAPPAAAPAAPKAAEAPKAEAPAEKPAEPAKSIFDAGEGANGAWPKSVVADPSARSVVVRAVVRVVAERHSSAPAITRLPQTQPTLTIQTTLTIHRFHSQQLLGWA